MRITFALILVILTSQLVVGQRDKEHLVNFRSKENPHYWKNKLPRPGYWQQDVHYEIKATIDDSTDIIIGDSYKLTYYNNSPDTLKELYFHLFQNAFQPGSYYHSLNIENDVPVKFGKYEAQGLGTVVEDMRVNGQRVTTQLDNTILKVILNEVLAPNDSLVVTCQFKTYFDDGSMRRRMDLFESWGYKHYNGVHWYPAITVYDEKFGWTTDQHLDKEFYNNFGQFDIELTFPQEYIVEATGVLVNREEVMPDSLRAKLDMKNFADKPFKEAPSVIIPREKGKTKTWKYHAINVHNFAFTADPTYRIDEVDWNGIKVIALAQEPHASKWQLSAEFTAVIIKIYSTDFGMYEWPKIIVADARDGMEYPMLTLDGGTYPQHQSLLAHEVGHMWFYGMVANNETYRAYMDEGFTQFLTAWALDKLMGGPQPRTGANKFITKYLDPSDVKYTSLYYPYLNHVAEGYDERINQHSAAFNGAIRHGGNYGLVYYKAGTMLYNLRYVLGDELFLKAMQYYVQRWKFAHPYPEDFRQAIIDYTKADLNWFFDQWLESDKFIDYGIKKVKKVSEDEYDITFIRKGRMHMPIDFTVTTKDSVEHKFIIPNTWFVKQSDATVLPKWYGWDRVLPTYTARIKVPGEIISVEIDPDHYLADVDLRDNKVGKGGISTWQFDHRVPNIPSWTKQRNYWRPDLWYNNYDGVQVGLAVNGKYFKQASYSATAWLNTGVLQNDIPEADKKDHQWIAFDIRHRNTLYPKVWRNLTLHENAYYNAGIWKFRVGLEKVFQHPDQRVSEYSKVFINTKYLINDKTIGNYLLYPNQWGMEGRGVSSY
ncbi:MAG TPA: M1 family metallopeptidase, partial [Cytophagaceae bacterium]